ncbi:MAG: hypothetical protein WC644_12635 [Ignavibacteria bacterium]
MKLFLKIFLWAVIIIVLISLIPYIISPAYEFDDPSPFKGSSLYNPYKDIQNNNWYKANLHSHSDVWGNLADGRSSTPEAIHKVYSDMDYDIIGISNYMNLNVTDSHKDKLFPVYEHGFGIWKNHYLVVGADDISLIDFVYYPTLNNKQFLINLLKTENNLISIVHPWMRNAVSLNDVAYLDNYDCIEICRYSRTSVEYVDKALSSGKSIKLIANDDSHNINDQDEIGKGLTIINSKSKSYDDLISAVRQGSAVSVNLIKSGFNSFELKNYNITRLPNLIRFDVTGDSISLAFDSVAAKIKFIGQDGVMKSIVPNTYEAAYTFKNDDSYIRVETEFSSNAIYYLNPVYRYDSLYSKTYTAKINYPLSVIYYVLWISGIIIVVLIYKRKIYRKNNL